VNFTTKQVRISHDPSLTAPALVNAFAGLGFDASPLGDLAVTNSEAASLVKSLAVAGFAAMNIMLLSVSVWSGAGGLTRDLFHWLSALIALPTVAYAGQPFFRSAWSALKAGHTNMDVPISIGVTLATALSLFETITHGAHAYFDSAVMLLFFLLAGRWLDAVMRDRARDGVSALLKHMASGALVVDADGHSHWVAASALEPGMTMLVAAGERLAADGIITEGRSHFDQSLITGEAMPVAIGAGGTVLAGTLNTGNAVHVRVTAAGADTGIADIARLMQDAAQGRSRYVRIADRAARLYAPAVHALALVSFIGWMLAGAGWHESLLIAVAVLIITCPCALGLAVPAAQIVAAGALMKAGVLVKDGSALERLAEADAAVFDKTGTLTLGTPTPADLSMLSATDAGIVLALAQSSRHPLSEALRAALTAARTVPQQVEQITEIPGEGLTGMWNGQPVRLGRPHGDAGDAMATAIAVGDGPELLIPFTDPLRPDAESTTPARWQRWRAHSALSGAAVSPRRKSWRRSWHCAVRDGVCSWSAMASTTGQHSRPGMFRWRRALPPMPARMLPMPSSSAHRSPPSPPPSAPPAPRRRSSARISHWPSVTTSSPSRSPLQGTSLRWWRRWPCRDRRSLSLRTPCA
jgi:Cu2+-exporting ATPase